MNISGVGEMGVGETGVGEMGQIIGETGVGEMGVGETGTSPFIIVRNPQNKVRIKSGPSGLMFYWLTVLIAHDLYLLININIRK